MKTLRVPDEGAATIVDALKERLSSLNESIDATEKDPQYAGNKSVKDVLSIAKGGAVKLALLINGIERDLAEQEKPYLADASSVAFPPVQDTSEFQP